MSNGEVDVNHYDNWLSEDSNVAALVMRQWLEPLEGKDAVIFPPTYRIEQNKAGYNVDYFEDATSVCQIDSVGSQANRMEPIFKRDRHKHLVPQVIINARVASNGQERIVQIHLLEAGHRAADAIARFSTLGPELFEAFRAFQQSGDAEKLARVAPTSIVFGSWDSRATQAKLPRIVRSVIRAFDIDELHRSAQYSTIAGEILEGGDAEVTTRGPKAELGFAHVPAVMTHGGIRIRATGEIRREAVLNFVPLRTLGATSGKAEDSLQLRRYIFGLALVAFTAPQETFLREGCQLIPAEGKNVQWTLVRHDGTRNGLNLTHEDALGFATVAATAFGVVQPGQPADFDADLANRVLALGEKERKALLRQGPVTREAIERVTKKGKGKGRKKQDDQKNSQEREV